MKNLEKINFILTKENSGKLIVFFVLMLFTVFFETLSIALILPAMAFIIDSDLKTNSEYINDLLLYFTNNFERIFLIKIIFVLIFLSFLVKNLILIIFLWWNKNFVDHIYRKICIRLLDVELKKSYLDHVETTSALVVRNFNEVKAFLKYLENFVILIVEGIILLLITILLLSVEYKVTLIICAIIIFLVMIFRIITNRLIKDYGKARFYRSGEMMKTLLEILDNYKNIKIFNKTNFFSEKFKKDNFIYSNVNKKFQIIDNLPRFWLEIAGVIGLCLMVFFLLFLDYEPKSIVPILGMFAVAFFRIIPSVLRIVRSAQAISFGTPVLDQLLISLKETENYQDKYKEDNDIIRFSNKILFNNLSFHYPKKQKKVLDSLNFEIKFGQKIGIIGKTGVGKSTLIDLLLGFLKPTSGSISVDGKNIYENLYNWRSLIGFVPQKINVINGTIKDNIIFGAVDNYNDNQDQRLLEAIDKSEFRQVITGLKNGIDTVVGEKGLNLSGGQLQRLAFARALFHNPEILILDESTNALDPETEKKLINNLMNYENKKTIIMISHNLDTLKFCDLRYELKNLSLHKINE